MPELTQSIYWQRLIQHQQKIKQQSIQELFDTDPDRFERFSLQAAGILFDYSKNHITSETLSLLLELAESRQVKQAIQSLFAGEMVNQSEQRAALHTALRQTIMLPLSNKSNINYLIRNALQKMSHFVTRIHQSDFTDIINIGIGGSDLGPAMTTQALSPYAISKQQIHFVSSLDATQITQTLSKLNPKTTLCIFSSKSFSTQETIINANVAKEWLLKHQCTLDEHCVAVTANSPAAEAFGIAIENIFPLWEWVGGRYSIWSSIGLPLALSIGMENFYQFLAGAEAIDQHFQSTSLEQNIPVLLALLNIWYTNFFGAQTHAILPYDWLLSRFPAYLQQLEMESNGKSITQTGAVLDYQTGPIIWGEAGTNGQHAFHQLLHQGTQYVPIDFIIACRKHHTFTDQHTKLFANCLSQAQALMTGHAKSKVSHQKIIGNRPSSMLILPELSPYTLGALIALYEHKVYVSATIWQINPFDQWGVELGKQLANNIYLNLKNGTINPEDDSSTQGLMRYFFACQKTE